MNSSWMQKELKAPETQIKALKKQRSFGNSKFLFNLFTNLSTTFRGKAQKGLKKLHNFHGHPRARLRRKSKPLGGVEAKKVQPGLNPCWRALVTLLNSVKFFWQIKTFIFKLGFFDVASYLWLTYIATAAPYGTRTMSAAGSHSYQFSAVGSIMTGFVDSMCFQRTMALVVEFYSYFDSDKLMYSYVCWYSQNMSWQIEEFLIRSKSFNWIFSFQAYTTARDTIFMFWTRLLWNWKKRKVCICEKPFRIS